MMTLLACYLTGVLVFTWTLWFADELTDWTRAIEIAIWPLSLVVGTVRRVAR